MIAYRPVMFIFLALAVPLTLRFLLASGTTSFAQDAERRIFLGSLALSVILWLLTRLLSSILISLFGISHGDIGISLHEWASRILPCALAPILLAFIFGGSSGLGHSGLMSAYAGALSPFGVLEVLRTWNSSDPYLFLLFPIILIALLVCMPAAIGYISYQYGIFRIFLVVGLAAATWALGLVAWLCEINMWPIVIVIGGILAFGSWLVATKLSPGEA